MAMERFCMHNTHWHDYLKSVKSSEVFSSSDRSCVLDFAEFDKLNPMHLVPVLVDRDFVVSDSYAILLVARVIFVQYLEEKYPQKALLPRDPRLKALNLQVSFFLFFFCTFHSFKAEVSRRF
ncbi:hypothetical protein EUGRSUZ_C00044 [Eucalyptus grandis]|uniref:Uncharacterized protein n=2 Tax=Eucalyptus grandis TaxID=71139 RepID=A0ACC3L9F7_EUCGR|nr:hypothetical protein EUGRSUZ_C00044 [Eucalyptus grandis]